MKKKLFVSLCAILSTLSLCAQDIIVTTDAKKIEAKVLEVSKHEIKYKEMDNLDGPSFVLDVSEISSIIYANGKVVLYNQQTDSAPQPESPQVPDQAAVVPYPEVPSNVPVVDESTAQILLLSGYTITAQITELKTNYIAYTIDGKRYTLPASQIEKVTFLQNGQVKSYANPEVNTYSPTTASNTSESQTASTQTTKPASRAVYQGIIEFSGFVGNNNGITDGGIGIDIINGVRINKYVFMGLGVGSHDDFASYQGFTIFSANMNVFTDVRAYIPTKIEGFYPYLGTAIGPMISFYQGAYGYGQSVSESKIYTYAFFRINAGFDIKRFTLGLGYELWANKTEKLNYFFFKFGVRLGKNI